jgi:DNA-binding NarL/FixJ family response regulator
VPGLAALTCRERQVSELIIQGLSNKEIAASLGIAMPTVKTHVHHILAKLSLHRRSELAALILRQLQPDEDVVADRPTSLKINPSAYSNRR